MSHPVSPPKQVEVNSNQLFGIETSVVAATPTVFDTGNQEDFIMFLSKGGEPSAFVWLNQNNVAVGYVALLDVREQNQLEVRSLAVLPQFQNQGFGKTMMDFVERVAVEGAKDKIMLVTSPQNSKAVKFYKNLGYRICELVDDYYGDGTSRFIFEKQVL